MFVRGAQPQGSVFSATALLVGSTVGAGIFALPYVISKSGWLPGVVYLLLIGLVCLYVNLAYGEIILSTNGRHQFSAYVEKYLGKRWRIISLTILFVGFYGALAAYLIEIGNLLFAIFHPLIGGVPLLYSLGFFLLAAAAVHMGLKAITHVESVLVVGLIALVVVLCVIALPHIESSNLTHFNATYVLLPYGVVLFAFAGAGVIADMAGVLHTQRKKLRTAIIFGTLIPLLLYTSFVTVTIGVTGLQTTESAIVGLGASLGNIVLVIGAVFGIVSMSTSFLLLGLILKETFLLDLRLSNTWSLFLALAPPLGFLLLGLLSFVEILGITGAITGGLTGILFVRMHHAAKQKRDRTPEYSITQSSFVHGIVTVLFLLGMVYEGYIAITRFL